MIENNIWAMDASDPASYSESPEKFSTKTDNYNLFNFDSVLQDTPHETKLTRRIVTKDKIVLQGTKVVTEKESFLSFREVPCHPSELSLNIIKSCEPGTNAPSMPSLRLEMSDKNYLEPVRDRYKDWAITSQRDIINKKGNEEITPTLDIDFGKYENIDASSPLFWSAGFQSLIREKVMLRKAAIISDTNCIVTVYGLGITGRVVSNGGSSGKMIIMEVYSIWNCQKYMLVLNSVKLRILLSGKPHLLKPGKKSDLLNELIAMLYFTYTVVLPFKKQRVPTNNESDDASVASHNSLNTITTLNSTFNELNSTTYVIEHLSPPNLPEGYPRTIEEMIRIPPVPPESSALALPIISQSIHIGAEVRENGPKMRKRLKAVREREAFLREQEQLRIWNATPKIRRNLVVIRGMKINHKLVVLRGNFSPMRPTTVTIKAMLRDECVELTCFLSLGRIKDMLRVRASPVQWSLGDIKLYLTRILDKIVIERVSVDFSPAQLTAGTASITECMLNVGGDTGSELQVRRFRTSGDVLRDLVRRRRDVRVRKLFNPYEPASKPHETINADSHCKVDVNGTSSDSASIRSDYLVPRYSSRLCWTSLGLHSSRSLDFSLHSALKPFREVARNRRRMTSKSIKVGGVHCIYSLYILGPPYRGDIPRWPITPVVVEDTASFSLFGPEGEEEEVVDESNAESVMRSVLRGIVLSIEQSVEQELLQATAGSAEVEGEDSEEEGESDDEEEAGGAEEEAFPEGDDIMDVKLLAYDMLCDGLQLELDIYIPHSGEYCRSSIPAASEYRLRLSKADLYQYCEDRDALAVALQSNYLQFFSSAEEDCAGRAERAWDLIGHSIMSQCTWALRNKAATTDHSDNDAVSEAQDVTLSAAQETTSDTSLRIVREKLQRDAERLPSKGTGLAQSDIPTSTSSATENSESNDTASFATLTWSTVVQSRAMRVESLAEKRGKSVLLQVLYWQQSEESGVVCVDRERDAVYAVQSTDFELQKMQVASFRFMTLVERYASIQTYLSLSLKYNEDASGLGCVALVESGEVEVEDVDTGNYA